jgi:hypothetical protein
MKRIAAAAFLLASAVFAAHAAAPSKISGWISDDMCGAKHAGTGAACVKQCMKGGMKPVFVDEEKKAVYTIENPDAVKEYYGDHVTIGGTVDQAKRVVKIESIAIKQ